MDFEELLEFLKEITSDNVTGISSPEEDIIAVDSFYGTKYYRFDYDYSSYDEPSYNGYREVQPIETTMTKYT